MRTFFEGVGEGDTAGIWQETPKLRPEFRDSYAKKLAKLSKAKKSEEMI
jgi:3,8-divinyl chlorophyllide a/chlorophyllide a reductase subunit Y